MKENDIGQPERTSERADKRTRRQADKVWVRGGGGCGVAFRCFCRTGTDREGGCETEGETRTGGGALHFFV